MLLYLEYWSHFFSRQYTRHQKWVTEWTCLFSSGAVALDGRVEPGDMILEVNGVSFERMSNDDAVRTLREAVQRPGYHTSLHHFLSAYVIIIWLHWKMIDRIIYSLYFTRFWVWFACSSWQYANMFWLILTTMYPVVNIWLVSYHYCLFFVLMAS